MRLLQGCTPAMLVHDSRMLQMIRVGNLRLPEVMTTADEVDSQAKEAMNTYMYVLRSCRQARQRR
jgi:hypothetical protein